MLDIGWPELLLVAVITVLVVGPKELPRVLRTFTFWVRKAQALAREFQTGMSDLARQADLDDIKKDMDAAVKENTDSLKIENFDSELDPDNSIAGMFTGKAIRTPTTGQISSSANEEMGISQSIKSDENVEAPAMVESLAQGNTTDGLTARESVEIDSTDSATPDENRAPLDTKNSESTGDIESKDKAKLSTQSNPRPITTEDVPIDLDPLPGIADQR